jgi:endonuclease-3 related protein
LRRELLSVNGVGPETADSMLLYVFKRPVFVIDAYTKRVFSRHNFFKAGAAYEEAQGFFTKRLPADEKLFNEYHALIVKVAKERCRKRPDCQRCPLVVI